MDNNTRFIRIGGILVPEQTKALLCDMDGVLIDSLGLDVEVCNTLLVERFGSSAELSRQFIQSIFAYDVPTFWQLILKEVGARLECNVPQDVYHALLLRYNNTRQSYAFSLCPGVGVLLAEAREKRLKCAVVSNNPLAHVEEILRNVKLRDSFDVVVGNDLGKLRKKPAPDTYLYAAQCCSAPPEECVVLEDARLGIEAGLAARCYTIGVATGALTWNELQMATPSEKAPHAIYQTLE